MADFATLEERAAVAGWEKLVDNAIYLGVEHRHKEKEYGIVWRTQYQIEMKATMEKLIEKYGNPLMVPG